MKWRKLVQAGLIVSLTLMTIGEASGQTMKALKTTNNIEEFKDGCGARLVTNVQDFQLVEFSVCFRVFFFAHRDTDIVLIHSKYDQDTLEPFKATFAVMSGFFNGKPMIAIVLNNIWFRYSILWSTMTWNQVCLSYKNKSMTVVSDGKKLLPFYEELTKNLKPIPPVFLTRRLLKHKPENNGDHQETSA